MTQTLNFQIPMKENLTGAAWLSCAPATYPAADRWEGCMVCRAAPCGWRAMVGRSFKEGMWEGRKWQAFSVEPFYLTWSLYFWEIEMIIIPTSCNYRSWAMCCLALMKTRTRVRILLGKVQRHLNAAGEWIVGPMLRARCGPSVAAEVWAVAEVAECLIFLLSNDSTTVLSLFVIPILFQFKIYLFI